jgi:hypothetical protein
VLLLLTLITMPAANCNNRSLLVCPLSLFPKPFPSFLVVFASEFLAISHVALPIVGQFYLLCVRQILFPISVACCLVPLAACLLAPVAWGMQRGLARRGKRDLPVSSLPPLPSSLQSFPPFPHSDDLQKIRSHLRASSRQRLIWTEETRQDGGREDGRQGTGKERVCLSFSLLAQFVVRLPHPALVLLFLFASVCLVCVVL